MRSTIAFIKIFTFFLSGLVTIALQSTLMIFTKGPKVLIYPLYYHKTLCRLMGVKVIVDGDICTDKNVVYMGNHISYLDIVTLGSVVKGCFVAKKDIEGWPFFGILGKMQRTVYIDRDPKKAEQETKMLQDRLAEPLPLMIFPEGTSTNGKQIIPFKTAFFEIFLNKDFKIQPFTFSILEVDGQNRVTDHLRDAYAWHGDIDLMPHLWSFAKMKGAVVKIKFQEPILSHLYTDRKKLSADCYDAVVRGLDLSADPSYVSSSTTAQEQERHYANNTR